MIKVAVVGGPILSGGKKNLIMEYFRHIDKTQVQMDIICNDNSNAIPKEEIESLGGRVFIVPAFENLFAHTCALYKIFKREKYDVVHAYNSTMNLFPMFAAKVAGVNVRISESLSMAAKGERKTYIKLILKKFSHLFCNYYMACGKDCGAWQFGNRALKRNKIAIFKTAINTEANAYNPELRNKTRAKFGWQDKTVYGFIGRFEMQKNPLFLIDIMAEIRKKQDNAQFVIIGAGDMEKLMLQRINRYGIKDSVAWLGRREDIQQFYNAFDAFLLPSLYEGLPVVGLESQSAGLPIFFSTAVTPEASACELGIYTPLSAGAAAWAEKIIEETAKNMPIRRSHAKEVADAGFDSKVEADRMLQFYLDAVAKKFVK
ncbi:glycosyltransferase [Fibrobacter sp.]|uniref:glycosyltransferase n=1 Tax=Fibrobacter sp. TaxID=35828 RepID=UPI00262329FF|nr:glycosyltransferase [Fibrobacter sp.]MDD5943190.1 glycosyltransferase [Fibrobacter sp.]